MTPHTDASGLTPPRLRPLPLGDLRPTGWLRGQLERQRDGMGGKLDEFWPDVRDSGWVGGPAEGWERGPYWLDGMVPLAFLLDDPGLKSKVQRWVDYIIEHQSEDGWMGPENGDPSAWHHAGFGDYDVWPRMIVLKALLQYRNATNDPRIVPAAVRLIRRIDDVLQEFPLHEWGRVRWADLVSAIDEVYDLSGEADLLEIAERVRRQGYDWHAYAQKLPYRAKVDDATLKGFEERADGLWMNDDFLASHGANVAMGVKALPVWSRHRPDPQAKRDFERMLDDLDRHHGQVTGLFTSDEHLAGLNPSQGTETCTVVEYLFSLETALEVWGFDEAVVDRLERIAFNALPASARSDEWAHQYDQQANQVVCHVTEDRIYTNNGPDSNTFALEPHFGCCTANRHQGWPKFAARQWMRSEEGGLVALSYAPCVIDTQVDGADVHLEVSGSYPFADEITITVSASRSVQVPLHLRVPAWAVDAVVLVDGETPRSVDSGTTVTVDFDGKGTRRIVLNWDAAIVPHKRYNDAISFTRGPVVFAAAIDEEWRQVGGELPHATWEVHPQSPWNYAIEVDPQNLTPDAKLIRRPLGLEPFTPEGTAYALRVQARRVHGWELEHGAAAEPPQSPVYTSSDSETITMLPYGATRLRVTELPWVEV